MVVFQKTMAKFTFIFISVLLLFCILYLQFKNGFNFECLQSKGITFVNTIILHLSVFNQFLFKLILQGGVGNNEDNLVFSLESDKVGFNLEKETFRVGLAHAMGRLKLDQAIAKNQTLFYEKPEVGYTF